VDPQRKDESLLINAIEDLYVNGLSDENGESLTECEEGEYSKERINYSCTGAGLRELLGGSRCGRSWNTSLDY
jgi:hypothetical protein